MAVNPSKPGPMTNVYEFGPFRLDPTEGLLLRDGTPVPLMPKTFEVLRVLVENRGRLLQKDELMKLVWPESFVEEGNLSHHVFTLRKALGEDKGSAYIETVPKRGYRFIAPVREVGRTLGLGAMSAYVDVAERTVTTPDAPPPFQPMHRGATTEPARWRFTRPAVIAWVIVAAVALAAFGWMARNARSDRTPPGTSGSRTLAVLPFKPLVAADRDEWLEWGLAETLITRFSGVPGIVVRPISATRPFASLDQDPTAAGRQLGVEVVLDGSIQRSGDRIRITVRLIRTQDGAPLWARAFDERVADILAIQDSIAEQVAASLVPQLIDGAGARLKTPGTKNTEAYQLYLRARFLWSQRTTEGLTKAIEYFNRAIETDPGYAQAYSGLADCYQIRHDLAPHERMPKARSAALKALQLDPELAEGHVSLAGIREFYEWDRAGAERELGRAIQLDPRSAEIYRILALQLMLRRRFVEAERAIKQALKFEPLSLTVGKMTAWLAFHRRDYDQAISLYSAVLELDSHFAQAQREIGLSYLLNGEHKNGLTALRTSLELPENYFRSTSQADLAYAAAVSGDKREARRALAKLQGPLTGGYVDPYDVAMVYVGLEDKESAFLWLQRAYDDHSYWLSWLAVDPRWDPVHTDPRFGDLVRAIGLPEPPSVRTADELR